MPIKIDSLPDAAPAPAAPTGIRIDSLPDAPAVPAGRMRIDDLPDAGSAPFQLEPVVEPIKQLGEYVGQSPVGQALDALDVPGRAAAGALVRAVGTKGMKEQLLPPPREPGSPFNVDAVVPKIHYSDIINYLLPIPTDAPSQELRSLVIASRAGLGIAANVVGDPLFLLAPKVGQLTEGAAEAWKTGRAIESGAELERNLLEIRGLPAIPMSAVTDRLESAGAAVKGAVAKVPGFRTLEDATGLLRDPATGRPRVVYVGKDAEGARLVSEDPAAGDPHFIRSKKSETVTQPREIPPPAEAREETSDWLLSHDLWGRFKQGGAERGFLLRNPDLDAVRVQPVDSAARWQVRSPNQLVPVSQVQTKTEVLGRAASSIADAAGRAKQVAGDLLDSFVVWTGIPKVDVELAAHSAKSTGDQRYVLNWAREMKKPGFTEGENQILNALIERTSNLRHPEMGAEWKAAALGKNAGEVSVEMNQALPKILKEQGAVLDEARAQQVKAAALQIKMENATDIMERFHAGDLAPEAADGKVIENYLVHKISPKAEAMLRGDPKRAAALEEAGLIKKAEQVSNAARISTWDAGKKQRTMRTTLAEANQIMAEKVGLTDFFITDPIAATAMKRLETRKFLRDKELIDAIREQAVPKGSLRQVKFAGSPVWVDRAGNQFEGIPHPAFKDRKFMVGGKAFRFEELAFPKSLANKLSYYILPRETGMFTAFLDSYNRVFRGNVLFKVDYYLENIQDNLLKNFVNGVKLEDYVDTSKVLLGRGGTIEIQGKAVPVESVRKMLETYDVRSVGHFSEAYHLNQALFMGKKISFEQGLLNKAKLAAGKADELAGTLFKTLHIVGDRAENLTRATFFVSLLKRGYTPKMAAFEVEKWLFNFQRTTANMDFLRRFYQPFIQAALKTAHVAPGLVARKAWAINAYENTLMPTIQAAINDPVTSWAVQQLYPDYARMHDRIAGPMLPGNHWLAILAGAGNAKYGLPMNLSFSLPGGLGILNQFLLWDKQSQRQATASSPQLRSFLIMMTGKDPWSGANVDISKNSIDLAKRANYAIMSAARNVLGSPNLERYVLQKFEIGDPAYFEPASLVAFHGNLGKYAKVTNLDKEFLFRLQALASTEKELTRALFSSVAKEMSGRTADIGLANHPGVKTVVNAAIRPYSSAEVYALLAENHARAAGLLTAQDVLVRPQAYTSRQIAGILKNVQATVKELNQSYQVMSQQYFRAMQGARQEEIDRAADAISQQMEQVFKKRGPAQ